MSRRNSDDKISQLKGETIDMTNAIMIDYKDNNSSELPQKSVNLTKHLFSNQYLLYSDLNEYFAKSGVITALIGSLGKVQEQSKRDVLRLLHVLLQSNRSLRDDARKSDQFQAFLRRYLDQSDCWVNWTKYKHHINIASQLLVDKDETICAFNTASVRKLARKLIDDIVIKNGKENGDVLSCIVFYASSMFTAEFEEIPRNRVDEIESDRILSKEITARCMDIARDYIQDFKVFYTAEVVLDKPLHSLYKPKSEFSFPQICITITYYAVQSEQLRMNIFQSGIYSMMNNFISLKYLPESLLSCGLDILKLPSIDAPILKGVKNDYLKSINDKLNILLKREVLSEKIKMTIKDLLKIFEMSENNSFDIPTGEVIQQTPGEDDPRLIQITNINMDQPISTTYFGFEKWGHLDVDEWFADNHLEALRELFPRMTGRGLKQLLDLTHEKTKMEVVEFLMEKMKIDFEMTLQLMGALGTL